LLIRVIYLLLIGLLFNQTVSQAQIVTLPLDSTIITASVLTNGLRIPWEICWGPDDQLWMSERAGWISRIDPETGDHFPVRFLADTHEELETGLLGIALHPNFTEIPHLFAVYTYENELDDITEKLVRFTYDEQLDTLWQDTILLDNIPGASNHVGSRIIITPDQKIVMTTGDRTNEEEAPDLNFLSGKTLRLNLDGSIPEDNPYGNDSPVWSIGHRNAQGLVLAPNGRLYSSEHGPSSNDEINEILPQKDYGWDRVQGICETVNELAYCAENEIIEPMVFWSPSIAPAGLDYYRHPAIPEWQNSLLLGILKSKGFRVLKLNNIGDLIVGGTEEFYLNSDYGRVRDICTAPDGRIFLAISNNDFYGDSTGFGLDKIVMLESDRIIEELPVPDFLVETDSCGVLQFLNLSKNSGSYEWDFGFMTSTDEHPVVQFPQSREYMIRLKAFNQNTVVRKQYAIAVEVCTVQAVANFTTYTNCLSVELTNLSENVDSVLWNYGDGNQSTDWSPIYTYDEEGTYSITLSVYQGTEATEVVNEIDVVDCIPATEAGFVLTDSCLTVLLEDQSLNADGVLWDYGDGSMGEDNMHTYEFSGDYTISQIAINEVSSDTVSQMIGIEGCIEDGIATIYNQALTIYPNPAKSKVLVEWNKDFAVETVSIYSVYGKAVFAKSLEQNEGEVLLDTRALQAGIYHIVLTNSFNQQLFGIFVLY